MSVSEEKLSQFKKLRNKYVLKTFLTVFSSLFIMFALDIAVILINAFYIKSNVFVFLCSVMTTVLLMLNMNYKLLDVYKNFEKQAKELLSNV